MKRIGKEEGRGEGEQLLAELISKLLSLGKNDDVMKVKTDVELMNKLYVQYGLKKSL